MKNVNNKFAHLTNFAVNSKKNGFRIDHEMQEGHTWSYSTFWAYLKRHHGIDRKPVWEDVKEIIIKTIISGEADMRKAAKSYLKSRYSVHELFGFDVLLDANLKPWVLEVNVSPFMDRNFTKVHVPLLKDVLNLAGIQVPFLGNREFRSQLGPERKSSVPKHLTMDHRLWVQTLSAETHEKHEYYRQSLSETQQQTILDNLTADDVRMLIETIDEDNRKGQFERIFPGPDTGTYLRFFEQPRYYNLLLHQWISRFHDNQEAGRDILESLCRQFKHVEA
ncbi:tubulin polyglutamylase TTLL4-like [Lingula anatina]|uniref:Tubulin polyglutamylase TTLL4-like n=1 Tax=Lingula anatina TaxID=7574 RepID=A0A1S3JTN0_LINAN|nr:tubulin polyglutamylase TTLL4-like [Lingula anatina]|eukprot:XP_013413702.1 tubulin polyglutamylase TTLL4-like [Lingula anatina]